MTELHMKYKELVSPFAAHNIWCFFLFCAAVVISPQQLRFFGLDFRLLSLCPAEPNGVHNRIPGEIGLSHRLAVTHFHFDSHLDAHCTTFAVQFVSSLVDNLV